MFNSRSRNQIASVLTALMVCCLYGCQTDSLSRMVRNPFRSNEPEPVIADTPVKREQEIIDLRPEEYIASVYHNGTPDRVAEATISRPVTRSPHTGRQIESVQAMPVPGTIRQLAAEVPQEQSGDPFSGLNWDAELDPEIGPELLQDEQLQELQRMQTEAGKLKAEQWESAPAPLAPAPAATQSSPVQASPVPASPAQAPAVPMMPTPRRSSAYKYYDVPLTPNAPDNINLQRSGDFLTLVARDAPLNAVLQMIAQQHGLNLVLSDDVQEKVTVSLNDVPLSDALDTILAASNCTWVQQRNIIIVSRISKESLSGPQMQGRQVRVFTLNFVSAEEVEKVVTGLLSPVGKIFSHQTSSTDGRRSREQIIVEDLPEYLHRVEEYLARIDVAPRQVLIEAHILQVDLDKSNRHGVNLSYVTSLAGAQFTIDSQGFANPAGSPAMVLNIDGSKLDNVIEVIKETTDAKTLASPKVLVLNGQEAKIQIGSQLGYIVTTTTETSTLQNVDFMDVGVVLNVTPHISNNGQILMKVKPEVSTGTVNAATGVPDKDTTEVDTTVMLPDGQGIVLGGLIQEVDSDRQVKIPYLGDIKYVGRMFGRRTAVRERREIIITLVPRIVPYGDEYRCIDQDQFYRATLPLLEGPLCPVPRPEPDLFDAIDNPRRIRRRNLGPPVVTEPYCPPGSESFVPHSLPPDGGPQIYPYEQSYE